MKFLNLMTSFRIPDTGSVQDVHLMMRTAYTFWTNEGAWGSIVQSVVDVLKCAVLASTIFVLGYMVDWDAATTCATEQQCMEANIVHSPSFSTVPGAHSFLVSMFFVSAVAAVIYEVKKCVETAYLQFEMHGLLCHAIDCGARTPLHTLMQIWFQYRAGLEGHEQLPLDGDIPFLGDLSWSAFLRIFCTVVEGNRSTLRIQNFDELRAVQALMVYDNYFIALHQNFLHPELSRGLGGPAIRLIDPPLLKFLIQSLFNDSNSLDVSCDQHKALRDKLFYYLVAYCLFYPLLVSHAVVKILVKNVAALRTKPTDYMERQWTQKAWLTFRLFNEVPHVAEERLVQAQRVGRDIFMHASRRNAIARFLERVTGTLIVVIMMFSIVNPAVLLGGVAAGRSMVWWLSTSFLVYGAVYSAEPSLREYHHDEDVDRLIHLLHYERAEWRLSGKRCVAALEWDYFHSRIYLIATALGRGLVMPLILLKLYFDESVPLLIEFIQNNSSRVDGVGCLAASADFRDNYFNETPRGRPQGNEDEARFKREKSIASFASLYPHWKTHVTCSSDPLGIAAFVTELFERAIGSTGGEEAVNSVAGRAHSAVSPRTSGMPEPAGNPLLDSVMSSMRALSQPQTSRAHELQHLIVSQVDDRHRSSLRVAAHSQRAHAASHDFVVTTGGTALPQPQEDSRGRALSQGRRSASSSYGAALPSSRAVEMSAATVAVPPLNLRSFASAVAQNVQHASPDASTSDAEEDSRLSREDSGGS